MFCDQIQILKRSDVRPALPDPLREESATLPEDPIDRAEKLRSDSRAASRLPVRTDAEVDGRCCDACEEVFSELLQGSGEVRSSL